MAPQVQGKAQLLVMLHPPSSSFADCRLMSMACAREAKTQEVQYEADARHSLSGIELLAAVM